MPSIRTSPLATFAAAATTLAMSAGVAGAAVIDFEADAFGLLPDGTVAADDLQITTQFEGAYGVRFGIDADRDGVRDAGSYAILEARGRDGTDAFVANYASNASDVEAPAFAGQLGEYLLRTPTTVTNNSGSESLFIEYTSAPVSAASGQVWDIDGVAGSGSGAGTEQWRVTAFDALGNTLDVVTSPVGVTNNPATEPYEAAPWLWAVSSNAGDIAAIRIDFIGTKNRGVGLAFDNFNATQVPTPGSAVLAAAGLMLAHRRRRAA